jgi:glycogen phosphorylase
MSVTLNTLVPKAHSSPTQMREAVRRHVTYSLGATLDTLSPREKFFAVALAVRDVMVDSMLRTEERYRQVDTKRIYYLSMEFLIGRSLSNNLLNLGLYDACREILPDLGMTMGEVEEAEVDAALGNGGLGRLAACFLDSLATLGLPGYGYGINYEYGLFRQEIRNGEQIEKPDSWRTYPSPWQIERTQEAIELPIYGRVEHATDRKGNYNPMWLDWRVVIGVPHDVLIAGFGGQTVNYLRLYSAKASQEVDMTIFNLGDYIKSVQQKVLSETISKVLYPSISNDAGRELRLIQEYFLSACAVRDIVRQYLRRHDTIDGLPNKVAIQLNDTHPTLAIADLMRLLIDEHDMEWDKAWEITTAVFAYTNHTLMAEALEKWPVPLLEKVVPRHVQIIYEINSRFLKEVAMRWPNDNERMRKMSLIEEGEPRQARMANMAIVGSHSVNGVAAVHSQLVKTDLVPEFAQYWPEKFNNKTNGVTQRRWILAANPGLARLITDTIGERWITDLERLRELEPHAKDAGFQDAFRKIKRENKNRPITLVKDETGDVLDPDSLFDIQVKRIHEYKRQLLNLLHVVHEYLCLVEDGVDPIQPRTYLFAGKAAPGYFAAKQIIHLINDAAMVINTDPRTNGKIKVVFVPDYRVTLAEMLIPAADLSEQISTAGTEASGTGNMKFAMNGALTIGTMDGANIEICEAVGIDNIFIFGLTVEQIQKIKSAPGGSSYNPYDIYQRNPLIRRILDGFKSNRFCPRRPGSHEWVSQKLLAKGEQYFHLADLESYIQTHEAAARVYRDHRAWTVKAILNTARMGVFSSDRTILDYARDIWKVTPVL